MKIVLAVKYIIFLVILIPCMVCGCEKTRAEEQINVVTTIMPLQYFIEAIGGKKISATVMVSPGANPHTYEPIPSQMKALNNADLYVKVGSGIEFELAWMDKIKGLNKNMAVCDASKGIRLISMQEHACNPGHEAEAHFHGQRDPHIWLSPDNAILIAANIRDALIKLDPKEREFYKKNFSAIAIELDKLKRDIHDKLDKIENRKFMVFHPAWGYFAADFGLVQISAECSGKEPTPRQLKELIKLARDQEIKVIFVSPQFSQRSANVVAREIRGKVVVIDPLSGDYIENLRKTAKAIYKA
jgi:zinc transport system substrate-binding protein